MIMFTWWGGGQTRKDRPRDTDPRDIMLMYNMPTNIGFCEGESQPGKAYHYNFEAYPLRVIFFFLTTGTPWGFPLPIVNLISIGNWSRNEERYACPSLIIDYFLFFYSTFLLLRHNFSPAIIFVWCCWHLVTTSNEKCTTCCPLNLLTYERLEGEIGTFTFLIFCFKKAFVFK